MRRPDVAGSIGRDLLRAVERAAVAGQLAATLDLLEQGTLGPNARARLVARGARLAQRLVAARAEGRR